MNSKQLEQRLKDIDETLEKLYRKNERARIKSELKKLDVSRYNAMSLMVKVMDIIGV